MADSMWLNKRVMNVAFDENKINRMKTVTDKYYKTFRYTGSFDKYSQDSVIKYVIWKYSYSLSSIEAILILSTKVEYLE